MSHPIRSVSVLRACRSAHPCQCFRKARTTRRAYSAQPSSSSRAKPRRLAPLAGAFILAGTGVALWSSNFREVRAEAPPSPPTEFTIEEPRSKEGLSKEDNRNLISSQHLQVKRSWENPGVYAWGSNIGRVAAPDSDEVYIKAPRKIEFFDGALLRDLKLSQRFGAAINERGDLLQWGTDYSADVKEPTFTLKGKSLISLALSSDRIIALAASGAVYSVPVSREDQLAGTKPLESTWIPFWNARSTISYREVTPKLSWGERISSVTAGLSHALLLSSNGRVFSLAASSNAFPMHGELGIPGLTWITRPEGHFDQPHALGTLQGFDIKAITSGDHHNLVLDAAGRVFAFGDNSSGQLGFEPMAEIPFVDAPALLPMTKLYAGTAQVPKVTSIAAGGSNSFFTVDATRVAQPDDPMNVPMSYAPAEPARNPLLGKVTADTWACGSGILGTLGNGKWTHIQGLPTKIKSLSGLFEYDEKRASVVPIRLASLSVGATHAAAVMSNVTYLGARAHTSEHDTNWGADILWWGGNEFYQVGTGRRNNVNSPVYIGPLDGPSVDGTKREEHRFQITPRHRVKVGGRSVTFEQRVECGRCVTAVYSGL